MSYQPIPEVAYHFPGLDFSGAPDWATHAGRDSRGWHWFDHVPLMYNDEDFCTGVLERGTPGQLHTSATSHAVSLPAGPLLAVARKDMTHWTSWEPGNIVKMVRPSVSSFQVGQLLEVVNMEHPEYDGKLPVYVKPLGGGVLDGEWPRNDDDGCVLAFVAVDSSRIPKSEGGTMPNNQERAVGCFKEILAAANAYRADGSRNGRFHPEYGICGNIERMGAPHDEMIAHVKNNMIVKTPSYSGFLHYPVPGPDGQGAESAWDCNDNKWDGEYGALRITQLEELIHLAETAWFDGADEHQTQAKRLGFIIGHQYTDKRGNLYEFIRDDDSSNPMFRDVATGSEDWRSLSTLTPVIVVGKRSVKAFVKAAQRLEAKKAKLKAKADALQKQINELERDIRALDVGLTVQHSVKRV